MGRIKKCLVFSLVIIITGFLILCIALGITLYFEKNIKFISNFDLFIETLKTSIQRGWVIFTSLSVISFIFSLIFVYHRLIRNFFLKIDRDEKEKNNHWFWNQKTKNGSYRKFKNKFLAREWNNPNWIISYNKKLTKWFVNTKNSDVNSIIVGGTGSGKTQRVLLPNILYNINLDEEARPNFIISDPKKEIINFLGKRLEEQGYKIYAIDFLTPENSLKINPLSDILEDVLLANGDQISVMTAIQEINSVVQTLQWTRKDNADIWTILGRDTVFLIIKFLLIFILSFPTAMKKEHFNFITVQSFINAGLWRDDADWVKLIEKMQLDVNHKYHDYWFSIYLAVKDNIKKPKDTFGSVLAQADSALSVFKKDEMIKTIISDTESFNLNKITKESRPWAIVINYPDHKVENHFLVSMLIDRIYQNLIDTANRTKEKKLKRKTLFMLDEFGNLPNIPNFENKISICRSRNVFFNIVLQDYSQLKKYNTSTNNEIHKIIRGNAEFVYFLGTQDESTIKSISDSLGKKEVEVKSHTNSNNSSSVSTNKREQPVMKISDIKYKPRDYMIITMPDIKPLYIKSTLAYKHFKSDDYIFHGNEVNVNKRPSLWNLNSIDIYVKQGFINNIDELISTLAEYGSNADIEDIERFIENVENNPDLNDKEKQYHKELIEAKKQTKYESHMSNYDNEMNVLDDEKMYEKVEENWETITLAKDKIKSYKEFETLSINLQGSTSFTKQKMIKEAKIKCYKEYLKLTNHLGKKPDEFRN